MPVAAATLLYFSIVFGTGFLLGPIRVLLIEPIIGPVAALLCEAPIMLAAIVAAAYWVPRIARLSRDLSSLALMGIGALVLQQIADFTVGSALRGLTLAEQLEKFLRPEGQIYALLLLAFTFMPIVLNANCRRIP